jgi:hypothetical protein
MGELIQFPTVTEAKKLRAALQECEVEIKLCINDLAELNDMVCDLTCEYELMLNRLCELNGIELPEEWVEGQKDD